MKTNIHSITLDPGWLNRDVKTYAAALRHARFMKKAKSLIIAFIILAAMSLAGAIETGAIYVP